MHSPERKASPELTTKFLLGYNKVCLQRNAHVILEAMQTLSEPQNYPLVFGCMTGKDRTGTKLPRALLIWLVPLNS